MRPRPSVPGAVAGALLGVGLAMVIGGPTALYGLTLAPLAAVLGGWPAAPAARSARILAAGAGGIAALAVAAILALIRFRYGGATGWPDLSTLGHSRELQMVTGLVPSVLLLGGRRGAGRTLGAALGGAAVALVMGPVLIGLTALAAIPPLRPPVPAVVTLAIVGLVAWRRR